MTYSIFAGTMADMSWMEVQKAIERGAVALIPSGVIEQQGPHLPTGTDVYGSHLICNKMRSELNKSHIECLITPPFYWGINHVTGAFPGSFTSRKVTVKYVLLDMFECLYRWGIQHVFLVDIHGDQANGAALYEAIVEGRKNFGLDIRSVISNWIAEDLGLDKEDENFLIFDVSLPDLPESSYLDIHAGESSTAGMLKYFPKLVDTQVADKLEPTNLSLEDLKLWHSGGEIARNMTPQGYFGAPAAYSHLNIDEIDFYEGFAKYASLEMKHYLNQMRMRGH